MNKKAKKNVIGDVNIPNLLVDDLILSKRNDGMFLLSGIQEFHGNEMEKSRWLFNKFTAEQLLQKLALLMDTTPAENKKNESPQSGT